MKNLLQTITILLLLVSVVFPQTTTIQLPTKDNTSSDFSVTNSDGTNLLKLNADGGLLIEGIHGTGSIPKEGAGSRLMWYPGKSAFRAGYVSGIGWNDQYIGQYSVALGNNVFAIGSYSTAMGFNNEASGDYSTAMGILVKSSGEFSTAIGNGSTASGQNSTAMGESSTASGSNSTAMGYSTNATELYSTAMGRNTTAGGNSSTAMGYYTTASGEYSVAMGNHTTASASNSTAIGYYTSASGDYSTAMGYYTTASGTYSVAMGKSASTNGKSGSFVFCDNSLAVDETLLSSANNQMTMLFEGGYKLYTSDDLTTGAYMGMYNNGWSAVSDSTKKENIITADGEEFLSSISKIRLGSWNYKSSPKELRHYGPMAQDIFHYFGNDDKGVIGCDTLLSTGDMDGIMMIAIKALEKRTEQLKIKNEELVSANKELAKENAKLKKNSELVSDRISKLEEALNGLIERKTEFVKISSK